MSEVLQVLGGIGAAAASAAAILSADRRTRALAMLAALALAGALVAGEAWDGQLRELRDNPRQLAALIVVGAIGLGALAALFNSFPIALPLALIAALPFRIPIDAGGESSNLLVPLYLVIAAGVALELRAARRPGGDPGRGAPSGAARWLALALAVSLVLYAVQTAYSSDVSRAVQNLAFFLVPFAVMFVLLREADWTPRLLRGALILVAVEALVFAAIGIVQHETHEILWNSKLMRSNDFDLYFRVNSLFWDSNIYGRYLGLAIVLGAAVLVWVRDRRTLALGALGLAIVFGGLAFSFSQTSFLALLAGLGVLSALRWSWRRTLAAGVGLAIAGAALFSFTDVLTIDSQSGGKLEQTTSGRSRLASGGLDLVKDRPVQGHGSGSFGVEFKERNPVPSGEAVNSHTEPITIGAEQGALGLIAYAALLLAALALLYRMAAPVSPGIGGRFPAIPGIGADERPRVEAIAVIAIASGFAGLLLHTMGYAGFLADPLTWTLLAVATVLSVPRPSGPGPDPGPGAVVPSHAPPPSPAPPTPPRVPPPPAAPPPSTTPS